MAARCSWWWVALLIVLVACGGDDGDGRGNMAGMGGGDGDGDGDATSYCERVADIFCMAEQTCCQAPRAMEACVADVLGDCFIDDVVADPKVGLNRAGADAALAELQQRTAMCDTDAAAWLVEGFTGSYDGTVPPDGDCAPPNGLGSPRTELAIAFASCQNGDAMACLPMDETTWTCTARSAAGGNCYLDINCQDGLYCLAGSGMFDGTCTPRKADGEDCTQDGECVSIMCRDDVCVSDQQSAYCPE